MLLRSHEQRCRMHGRISGTMTLVLERNIGSFSDIRFGYLNDFGPWGNYMP